MHKELMSFYQYCLDNPDQRFWQAVRNWSEYNYVYVSDSKPPREENTLDTFYFNNRRHR